MRNLHVTFINTLYLKRVFECVWIVFKVFIFLENAVCNGIQISPNLYRLHYRQTTKSLNETSTEWLVMRQKGLFACPKRLASAYQHFWSLAAEPNNCSANIMDLPQLLVFRLAFGYNHLLSINGTCIFICKTVKELSDLHSLSGMIIIKKKRPKQTDDLFHASEKLSFLLTFLNAFI